MISWESTLSEPQQTLLINKKREHNNKIRKINQQETSEKNLEQKIRSFVKNAEKPKIQELLFPIHGFN